MSRVSELKKEVSECHAAIGEINKQLLKNKYENSNTEEIGCYLDWKARAKIARGHLVSKMEKANIELSELNSKIKQSNKKVAMESSRVFLVNFFDAARQVADKETFDEIYNTAKLNSGVME